MNCEYIKEISRDGYEILKIKKDDKEIFSTSRYNVKREIEKITKDFNNHLDKPYIFIFGLSNGEYIDDICKIDYKGKIYIVDYFEDIVENYKNSLKYDEDKIEFLTFYELENEGVFLTDTYVGVLTYGNYSNIFSSEINNVRDIIKKSIVSAQLNINTIERFSYEWVDNVIHNIPYIVESNYINEFKEAYVGKPAIIVSAGPSLEKELGILKENEDKFVIISGGRTLPTLKKFNINVDFTCVVDGGIPSYEVIKNGLDYKTNLIFTDITNKFILEEYKGTKTYFSGLDYGQTIKKYTGKEIDTIQSVGGSVAHTCSEFARYMGCSPIILLGQDLAYTNNKLHSDSASIEEVNIVEKGDIIVENVYGDEVYTDYALDTFRIQFEKYFYIIKKEYGSFEVINSSDGGAKIKGTSFKPFNEVVRTFNEKIDKYKINIDNTVKEKDKCFEVTLEIIKDMKAVINLCEELISLNKKMARIYNSNSSATKQLLKLIDNQEAKLKKRTESIDIVASLVYGATQNVIRDYKKRTNQTEKEILESVVGDATKLNNSIIEAIQAAIPMFEDIASKFKQSN
ncbi:MAG: 6-hydroxymethylpterin diphosphokinase MptE-like protein [Clostridium sp.]